MFLVSKTGGAGLTNVWLVDWKTSTRLARDLLIRCPGCRSFWADVWLARTNASCLVLIKQNLNNLVIPTLASNYPISIPLKKERPKDRRSTTRQFALSGLEYENILA